MHPKHKRVDQSSFLVLRIVVTETYTQNHTGLRVLLQVGAKWSNPALQRTEALRSHDNYRSIPVLIPVGPVLILWLTHQTQSLTLSPPTGNLEMWLFSSSSRIDHACKTNAPNRVKCEARKQASSSGRWHDCAFSGRHTENCSRSLTVY